MRVSRTNIPVRQTAGVLGLMALLWLPATAAGAAEGDAASASLTDVDGKPVGTVRFESVGAATVMTAEFVANPAVKPGYHGFHIHANNVPDAGEGCVADPKAEPKSWFLSVDGHFADTGQSHGTHWGDMPSVYIGKAGTGKVSFTFDHTKAAELVGKGVILHALADNYGNVPTGEAPDQYKANSDAAGQATGKTGNAGPRIACAVIESAAGAATSQPSAATTNQGIVPVGTPDTGAGSGMDNRVVLFAGAAMLAAAVAVSGVTLRRGSRREVS